MQVLTDVALAQLEFERWLERQPLADRTKREYARNVRVFLGWLTGDAEWDADPLTDRLARDHAARDFRRWLKIQGRAAASTVNLALASLDALYRQRGLGNRTCVASCPCAPRCARSARMTARSAARVRTRGRARSHARGVDAVHGTAVV